MDVIGVLTLGQTPRPDFERIFRRAIPEAKLLVRGALDGLSVDEIDGLAAGAGDYPLFTILRDGTTREIDLRRLKPLLDERARQVAAQGASISALMCAGDFPDLASPIPVLYPSRVLTAVARGVCRGRSVGVVTPNAGQVAPATAHWQRAGFEPSVAVASPLDPAALSAVTAVFAAKKLELIVLDCLGFPPETARHVRAAAGCPVLCPQGLLPRILAEMLGA